MCCIPRICLYIVFSVSRCQSGCKHSNSLCVLHINRICVVSHHQPNRWCQLTQRKLDFIRWPSEKRSCFIQIPYLNESSSKDPSRKYGCFHIAFPILKAMKNYPSGDLHLDRSHHGDEPRHCCDFGKLWGVSRETVPKKTLDEMECINLDLDLHAPTCWSVFFWIYELYCASFLLSLVKTHVVFAANWQMPKKTEILIRAYLMVFLCPIWLFWVSLVISGKRTHRFQVVLSSIRMSGKLPNTHQAPNRQEWLRRESLGSVV